MDRHVASLKKKNPADATKAGWLPPLLAAGCACLAFWPSLWNGFVWDDAAAVSSNVHIRSLGAIQLRWMFTTFQLGHYQPLTWISLALNYFLSGNDPFGYHAVNLLLHAANTVLFYKTAVLLLDSAMPDSLRDRPRSLAWGAAFAAAAFAAHPLRVESVAWVTERRDVLSGFFFLLSVFLYLKHQRRNSGDGQNRLPTASIAAFVFSLMAKASGVGLPVVLLILDFYPLRRLNGPAAGKGERARIYKEKIPYAVPALIAAILAPIAQYRMNAMEPLAAYGFSQRAGQALYGAAFYLWKTLVPLRLMPLYRFPDPFHPLTDGRVWLAGAVVLGFSLTAAFGLRRRPAFAALWAYYLVMIAPVLGFFQSGPQLAADRYTYLPCLGWALLGGAGIAALRGRSDSRRLLAAALGSSAVITLASLTWKQTQIWHDPVSLWSRDAALDPGSALAHNNLCSALRDLGRPEQAAAECEAALRLRPDYENARGNVASLLADQGKLDEAVAHYQKAVRANPGDATNHLNLGRALRREGRLADAAAEFEAAASAEPDNPAIRDDLGDALKDSGRVEDAARQYQTALDLDPADPRGHEGLGTVDYQRQRFQDAVREYQAALQAAPKDAQIHTNLGAALDAEGNLEEAALQYRLALKLEPDHAAAYNNLGIVLFKQGKVPEALESFRQALRINPNYDDARFNLERAQQMIGRTR